MKKNNILFKDRKNTKDGYPLTSKYWQDWKKTLPLLPLNLKEIAIGMILGDACMYKVSREAIIKFEQGYKQEEFIFHLFDLFKLYCFMEEPGTRLTLYGDRKGLPKSFWFKTFSHESFTEIWNLFYVNKSKQIQEGLITNHLTPIGLAYWIMADGSLDSNTMTLHTQGFTKIENNILSKELNAKFGFQTKVIAHKEIYSVIKFDSKDAAVLNKLTKPYIIPSMNYKLPIV